MARARNIKPSFFKNEHLAELPFATRLLFIGLWTLADREGRLEDRPKRIRMEVFPGDDVNVDEAMNKLHVAEFIERYEVAGRHYIQVINFPKHQNPHHREPASTIPAPQARPGSQPPGTAQQPEADTGSQQVEALGSPEAGRADSGFLITDSRFLSPDSGSRTALPSGKRSAGRGKRAASDRKNGQSKTGPTEQAYVAAYTQRYHVAPVINAKVRGMFSRFIDRVPANEAPQIAGFYVLSNRGLYVAAKHCVDLLLRDAEALRTAWATGSHSSDTEARLADRTQATGNAFSGLLKESGHAH